MCKIKFRGRFWNKDGLDAAESQYRDGEFVYGGYARMKTLDGYGDYIIDEHGIAYLVHPESVAQLVGHDANGKEVYEGDIVIRYDSKEEFDEAPENGVSRKVVLYTAVNPDLEGYYCFLKEDKTNAPGHVNQ